jgi:hypothetical protein
MATEINRELVHGTIADLEQVRESLMAEREKLEKRITAVTMRIRQWQNQLGSTHNGTSAGEGRARRRKGENLQSVTAVLQQEPPDKGLTMKQVAEKAGIPWSSARNILQSHKDRFEERGGLWYVKGPAEKKG